MWQALVTQAPTPFATVPQVLKQEPQLLGSLTVFAQFAPQQVRPAEHCPFAPQAPTQSPPEQLSPAGHAWPQVPQFWGSLAVSTSQPSATWWSQSANGWAQAPIAQPDPVQTATALAKGPQTSPQLPQSLGLVEVSTQSGEQQVRPFVQAWPPPQKPTHWKLSQVSPFGHWELSVHWTQMCSETRQCGVGDEQLASD
jgi:hypothetical protein